MSACCVSGCKNRHSATSKLKFYRIPSGHRPFQANRRRLWLQALQQVNGTAEGLKGNVRVCGAHFISGEASMDHDNPDFVPSVFTSTKPSPKKKVKKSYGRRRRRSCKAKVEKEEITIPPRVDSPVDVPSVLMETESELSEERQRGSMSSVPKEEETLTKGAETRSKPITLPTTSSPNKSSQSVKLPAGISNLDKMSPVVLIKPLHLPVGAYQCELGSQSITSVSQLGKHKRVLEEETSFICEICGKHFTGEADFAEHQCVCTDEPSFPCNMCDRSFTTSHNLKRHKLLHVKDGRKCSKCGVLFCRRHNHILFLPQAEPKAESEQDSSVDELQNVGSNAMPENCLLQESEQSRTDDMDDDAQDTVTPSVTTAESLSKTCQASPPVSHATILLQVPVTVLVQPSSVLCPPPPAPRDSEKPGTSSQLMPPLPDKPATMSQPHLPLNLELPPSLQIFSPKYLTSALLEVKRNYEYILNRPKTVKKVIEVKEEQCELPLITPQEQRVEQVKKERTAYDLEIEI